MGKPNNYLITLFLKFVLILVFSNIYNNFYRDTNTSFFQENNERKLFADSAELSLKISSDSIILKSYKDYRDILKVQKSSVDNIYNKIENKNSENLAAIVIPRPEHRATTMVKPLSKNLFYGDTIAIIIDSVCNRNLPLILRETRQTFALGYKHKKVKIGNLSTALDNTRLAIDYDRKLSNRIIENAEKEIANTKRNLADRKNNIGSMSYFDFVILTATIEFTFNYTDIIPSSSKILLICLIHKIIAGVLYFILINQLKKKFFP